MANLSDIDKNNPNKICGVDWGLVPIPQNYDDLYANFGNPADADFANKYIISLPHYVASGEQITVQSHIAMVTALHDVFGNYARFVSDYGGCYVVRNVRGGAKPSLHSWGLAIDLNVAANPLGSTDRSKQPRELVQAFKNHGFWWGADYHNRKDPMHFQRAGDF